MKILSMSGYIPEHICDTIRFTQYPGDRSISHYCGYASDFISQVLHDETIDGAVYPKTCDSSRILSSYLSQSKKFIYQLNIPVRETKWSKEFFANNIQEYQRAVEANYHIQIEDLIERCKMINKRNSMLFEAYESLEELSYSEYISYIHYLLKTPLFDQRMPDLKNGTQGKKAYIIGSFLSNLEIAREIEIAGFNVVGDNLPESGRMVSRIPVDINKEDIYMSIADSILSQRTSPSQNCFHDIIKKDIEIINRKKAEAVFYISQKYCEPYDFLFPIYKDALDGIPILHISLNDTEDIRNVRLSLEAFANTVF